MKHTKGPWKICDHGEDTIAITDELQDYGICVVGSAPIEQVRANAHLIAAAPEMLDVLRTARGALVTAANTLSCQYKTTEMLEAITDIDDLIFKARGLK